LFDYSFPYNSLIIFFGTLKKSHYLCAHSLGLQDYLKILSAINLVEKSKLNNQDVLITDDFEMVKQDGEN